MSQTVFVLEDDTDISRLVQHHLEAAGFTPRVFHTPTNLIPDAERQAPALFPAGHHGSGGDGLDVCRRLRNHPALSTIPIIFLTARAGENDRVLGLELGADDYITKPFATRELVARVKAVLRRFERPSTPTVISFEEVIIDAQCHAVKGARRAHHHYGHRVPPARLPRAAPRPGLSAGIICWMPSGAMPASSLPARSMSMSAASVRRSRWMRKTRVISRPFAAQATASRFPKASKLYLARKIRGTYINRLP